MRTAIKLALVVIVLSAAPAAAQRLLYSGLDPSCHQGAGGGGADDYTVNVVNWVGGGSNPNIGWVNADSCSAGELLSDNGFTNVTEIDIGDLDTADLAGFDMLWIGRIDDESCDEADDAESNVAGFSGGIATEDSRCGYAWLPMGDALSISAENPDEMEIVEPGHPTMAGLTDGGLSGWGNSAHVLFLTTGAFTTVVVATDEEDFATLIVFEGAVPTAGGAWLLALALLLMLAGAAVLRRRAIA